VSVPPPADRMRSKLFSPVAPFVSASVIVRVYSSPGVYDPTGIPLVERKAVVLSGWQLLQLPPSLVGVAIVESDAGMRANARRAIAPSVTATAALLPRRDFPPAVVALILRGGLMLSVIPFLLVNPVPSLVSSSPSRLQCPCGQHRITVKWPFGVNDIRLYNYVILRMATMPLRSLPLHVSSSSKMVRTAWVCIIDCD